MKLIDAHCHLQADCFKENITEILSEARNAGVGAIINAATEPNDWLRCREISAQFPEVKLSLGIHPWYIPENYTEILSSLTEQSLASCIAISEIGLDYRHSRFDAELQKKIFTFFLDAAEQLKKPAVVHCIAAFDDMLKIIRSHKISIPVILHAFNGSAEQAKQLSKFNIFFSLGGTLTHEANRKRKDLVKYLYPSLMLLETDAPDFIPRGIDAPFNRPALIRSNLAAAAALLELNEEDVAEKIYTLSSSLFSIK